MISKSAKIGKNAEIQPNVFIGMHPKEGTVSIGEGAVIRSGTIIYSGVTIGSQLRTGHNALIRENTFIGNNVVIGTGTVIDGDAKIGNNVSIQTGVYIPALSVIEDGAFLGPKCTLANDKYMKNPQIGPRAKLLGPHICNNARLGANSVILPGITVGEGAIVGAGSVVTTDVPARKVVVGNPARVLRDVRPEELPNA